MLVFRHGYWNVAYGNFFINGSGGIRIKEGANHYVYNNYFATGSADAIKLQYVAEYPLTNVNFVHNTFVNSGEIDLSGAGPTGVTFANNIFKKSSGNIFSNPNGGTSWAGNIYQGTLGITISSGMTNADPRLAINSHGYYGLTSLSPAIDASSSSYPAILDIANVDDDPSVLLDISGQSRPVTRTLKDVGCDEYTTGSTFNHPLALSEVGPSYLGGPTSAGEERSSPSIPEKFALSQNYPNPFNPSTIIRYQVPITSKVQLAIVDCLGRTVEVLVDRTQTGGHYQVEWNAARHSSGLYFCRIQAGPLADSKKMILVK